MAIQVKLQSFEGPLDLLLHLIDKNKVDIYDIPISMITEQYMKYIEEMEKSDLNIMSEFLVMAATLLDIKCRMLLPKEEKEEKEEDPREELVARLLEYKMFKFISLELKDRQVDAEKSLFKLPSILQEEEDYNEPIDYKKLIGNMNLAKLNAIFQSLIRRQKEKIDPIRSQFSKVEKDEVSMEEKIRYVENYGETHGTFRFRTLLKEQERKIEMVVTFLALLELMKTGVIRIEQKNLFDDILISYIA